MSLNSRTICYCLIRIHTLTKLLSIEIIAQHRLDFRDARASTDQNHFIDIRQFNTFFILFLQLIGSLLNTCGSLQLFVNV